MALSMFENYTLLRATSQLLLPLHMCICLSFGSSSRSRGILIVHLRASDLVAPFHIIRTEARNRDFEHAEQMFALFSHIFPPLATSLLVI